jgi:hypothetical protein
VVSQSYSNWSLYIIIDDRESNYHNLAATYKTHPKIKIIQNQSNVGKNASLNQVLDELAAQKYSGYVVYLDDDDWLDQDCLTNFHTAILQNKGMSWLVSNRTRAVSNESFTAIGRHKQTYSYPLDVLVFKNFYGDATHCIHFLETDTCRFPTHIKNAEEWIYFAQISKKTNFVYINKNGTLSHGYSNDGLTYNWNNNLRNYINVLRDCFQYRLFSPLILIYLLGRFVKMTYNKLTRNRNKIWS